MLADNIMFGDHQAGHLVLTHQSVHLEIGSIKGTVRPVLEIRSITGTASPVSEVWSIQGTAIHDLEIGSIVE